MEKTLFIYMKKIRLNLKHKCYKFCSYACDKYVKFKTYIKTRTMLILNWLRCYIKYYTRDAIILTLYDIQYNLPCSLSVEMTNTYNDNDRADNKFDVSVSLLFNEMEVGEIRTDFAWSICNDNFDDFIELFPTQLYTLLDISKQDAYDDVLNLFNKLNSLSTGHTTTNRIPKKLLYSTLTIGENARPCPVDDFAGDVVRLLQAKLDINTCIKFKLSKKYIDKQIKYLINSGYIKFIHAAAPTIRYNDIRIHNMNTSDYKFASTSRNYTSYKELLEHKVISYLTMLISVIAIFVSIFKK